VSNAQLRVALVAHTLEPGTGVDRAVRVTAKALADAGHDVALLTSHRRPTRRADEHGVRVVRLARLPEAPLRWRGFTGPLTHGPLLIRELARGDYDVAHAFTPEDAGWARTASRSTGLPIAFGAAEALGRDRLADRRLRFNAIELAIECDAVIAPSKEQAALADRWLAVDAEVIDPRDAAGHERLYRELISRRSR
jgi:hypothetical protein